jgi:hypothetical protein
MSTTKLETIAEISAAIPGNMWSRPPKGFQAVWQHLAQLPARGVALLTEVDHMIYARSRRRKPPAVYKYNERLSFNPYLTMTLIETVLPPNFAVMEDVPFS